MLRHIVVSICLVSMLAMTTGCRNRCTPGCPPNAFFGANQVIPAPATYSVQIPSQNNGQAYYNPNSTARQPTYLLNPNGASPTPATGGANSNQPGWRAVGSESQSGANVPRSVLQQDETTSSQPRTNSASTTLAQVQPPSAGTVRTATATNGLSYRDSVNYRTTRTDERLDRTRLPATDATSVRAPSGINTVTTGTRMAQLNPTLGVTLTQPIYAGQPRLASASQWYVPPTYSQTQVVQPAQPTTIAGTYQPSTGPVIYQGVPQPYVQPGVILAQPNQPSVIASSTATFDPNNASPGGWRDRELTTRR